MLVGGPVENIELAGFPVLSVQMILRVLTILQAGNVVERPISAARITRTEPVIAVGCHFGSPLSASDRDMGRVSFWQLIFTRTNRHS